MFIFTMLVPLLRATGTNAFNDASLQRSWYHVSLCDRVCVYVDKRVDRWAQRRYGSRGTSSSTDVWPH
jgi:hypothetical protein